MDCVGEELIQGGRDWTSSNAAEEESIERAGKGLAESHSPGL